MVRLLWGRCALARDREKGPGDGAEACAVRLQANKGCGSWLLQISPEASSCHGLDAKHMA